MNRLKYRIGLFYIHNQSINNIVGQPRQDKMQ